jgi:hypothetical protein
MDWQRDNVHCSWLRRERENKLYIVCSADVCACVQTRIHAVSCHAMMLQARPATLRAHLASRDIPLSQDHRTRDRESSHCPHPWCSPLSSYRLPPNHAERRRSRQGSRWPRSRKGFSWSSWWPTWRWPRWSRWSWWRWFCTSRTGRARHLTFLCYSNSCLVSIFAEGQPAPIDARLANSAEDRLILSFKSLSLRQDAMPPRPNYGTKG